MEHNLECGAPMEKKRKMNVIGPVELELCSSQAAPEEEQLQNQLSEMKSLFGQMLYSEFTDVKVVSRDVEIFAHKSVLFGRIPYFKEVLTYDATEQNEVLEVPPEISPDTVKLIIRYAYFCEPTVTLQNAQALLEAAAYFRIEDLWTFCDEFITKRIAITVENCLTIQSYAVGRSAKLLKTKADLFVAENLGDVCASDALKYLSEEEMEIFLSIKDIEALPNEENFWEALIKWVKADPKNRKSPMPKLLGLLRLPRLSAGFINQTVLSHPLIKSSDVCRVMVNDLLLHKADPSNMEIKQRCEAAFSMKQRCKKMAHIFYFDVWKAYDGIHNRIYVLKSPDGEWVEKPWKGFPIMLKKVVAVKYIVYLVSRYRVLLAYNSITETSTVIQGDNGRPDLLKLELGSVNGKLVACGPSRVGNQVLVYCYVSSSNSWQQNAFNWPEKVNLDVTAFCGAKSGENGDNEMLCIVSEDFDCARVILFDIETGDLIRCGIPCAIGLNDDVTNFVGYNDGNVFIVTDDWIQQYDVALDEWNPLPGSDVPYLDSSDVAVANHRLYIISTTMDDDDISSVVTYKDLADSNSPIVQHGSAPLKNADLRHYDNYCYHTVVCQYP